MMRKTSLIFLGAIAGAGLTLLATQPHSVLVGSSAKAASSDTYRQLNLFGEVFERVRANYVEKKARRIGNQRHAHRPRSAFELYGSKKFSRDTSGNSWRVRRP